MVNFVVIDNNGEEVSFDRRDMAIAHQNEASDRTGRADLYEEIRGRKFFLSRISGR